jgi:hypothetical protein
MRKEVDVVLEVKMKLESRKYIFCGAYLIELCRVPIGSELSDARAWTEIRVITLVTWSNITLVTPA